MRRQITAAVLLCLLMACAGLAENESAPAGITALTEEELLQLKEQVDARLMELGVYPFIVLERASSGGEVVRLQERLQEMNYYSGEPTGKFDSMTQMAMKRFEEANGLHKDGIASIQDQRALFSREAAAGPSPTPTPAPIPSQPEPLIDPLKSQYETIDYDEYARYPERYAGRKVYLKGKVEQVLGSRQDGYQIRLSVLNNVSSIIYVYITADPGFGILEGDRLEIYARLQNTITYEAVFGQKITIPAAVADIVELL